MKLFIAAVFVFYTAMGYSSQRVEELIYKLRDPKTSKESFRTCLESIGEYLACKVMDDLVTETVKVSTLTGHEASSQLIKDTPCLVTILRAGLPMHLGALKVFPEAESGFIAMSRDEVTLKARMDYVALPTLTGKVVIITDTMLATGGSLLEAIRLVQRSNPIAIYVLTTIASEKGMKKLLSQCPDVKIWAACIDPDLNEHGFIVPGLGDAGDRSYGSKH